jgi:hypothetical protein
MVPLRMLFRDCAGTDWLLLFAGVIGALGVGELHLSRLQGKDQLTKEIMRHSAHCHVARSHSNRSSRQGGSFLHRVSSIAL